MDSILFEQRVGECIYYMYVYSSSQPDYYPSPINKLSMIYFGFRDSCQRVQTFTILLYPLLVISEDAVLGRAEAS